MNLAIGIKYSKPTNTSDFYFDEEVIRIKSGGTFNLIKNIKTV